MLHTPAFFVVQRCGLARVLLQLAMWGRYFSQPRLRKYQNGAIALASIIVSENG